MADLALWKKYPLAGEEGEDSYRLDHPTFQNVQRTTFAKGTITDFKKIADDPIEVESMVKVEVEGYGESDDYIPLFYHPKEHYWDDEENSILATDYDEEQKCHKRAWMSFRCGDEVVVLMQAEKDSLDLKPKYVLGFVDNYPRIGENAIKVKWTTDLEYCGYANDHEGYYCGFGTPDDSDPFSRYGELDTEPDPGDKNLEKICITNNFKKISKAKTVIVDDYDVWRKLASGLGGGSCCTSIIGPLTCPSVVGGYTGNINEVCALFRYYRYKRIEYSDYYFFPIGPILFCYEHKYYQVTYEDEQIYLAYSFINWPDRTCADGMVFEDIPNPNVLPPTSEPWTWIAPVDYSGTYQTPVFAPPVPLTGPFSWNYTPLSVDYFGYDYGDIHAQIFTPELWDNPKIDEMTLQSARAWWEVEDCAPGIDQIEFIVTPHTKEEIIEAEWLNEDGSLPEETAA